MGEKNKIPIKVGITNHTFSDINSTDTTVKLNFEVYFSYEEDEVLRNFQKIDLGEEFEFPFHIQNALEITTKNKWISYTQSDNIYNVNYHINNKPYKTGKKIRLEKYNILCELKIINFTSLSPFNTALIPIKIITNGCPGSQNIKFIPEINDQIMWGVRTNDNLLNSDYWMKNGYILTPYIKPGSNTDSYNRIYFILSYKFGIIVDIIKYYFIPTLLTIILILFYDMDEPDFAGLFSTLILGDIALLFILPSGGEFSKNEKSVCLNMLLILIITIVKISEINISLLVGVLTFSLINIFNLSYDIISTNNIKKSFIRLLNSVGNTNEEFGKVIKNIDALDYVTSGSGEAINTLPRRPDEQSVSGPCGSDEQSASGKMSLSIENRINNVRSLTLL